MPGKLPSIHQKLSRQSVLSPREGDPQGSPPLRHRMPGVQLTDCTIENSGCFITALAGGKFFILPINGSKPSSLIATGGRRVPFGRPLHGKQWKDCLYGRGESLAYPLPMDPSSRFHVPRKTLSHRQKLVRLVSNNLPNIARQPQQLELKCSFRQST